MERSQKLLSVRPLIASTAIVPNMSKNELFQNQTLRPILKLQNVLFLMSFQNYIKKMKNTFYELTLDKRIDYITNAIQKDVKFRNSLKGMVIGQFTEREYDIYIQNSSSFNKRIMNMVIKRLQDQIQYFDEMQLVQ